MVTASSSTPYNEEKHDDRYSNSTGNSSNDTYRYYYSVLNVPRDADLAHIQRNYKLLSRIYHPDKATATASSMITGSSNSNSDSNKNSQDVAQQSFVMIKTAVDVLCDSVYRFVYDYGDDIAVTLVKRSQTARHSEQQQQQQQNHGEDSNDQHRQDEKNDANNDENDDDLYTMIKNKLHQQQIEEAISILHEVLENYYSQQQNLNSNLHASKFDLSCSIPMTWKKESDHPYDDYYRTTARSKPHQPLQQESISLNVQSRYPVNNHWGITLGAASEVHSPPSPPRQMKDTTKQNNNNNSIKGSIGVDVQPLPGTNIYGNITTNLNRSITSPDISISTSRKCYNESVIVAAIHGNVQNSKSWYTSFISSKPILYETIFGPSFGSTASHSKKKKKLVMNWRIICDMVGRLRGFMMSLRNMEYPMWSCRLSMSNYPIKVSWCGSETDTFYIAVAFGIVDWPRIKIVRISSFGTSDRDDQSWKVKYGFKHDPQQLYSGQGLSLWSVVCTIQYANEFTFRVPIRLFQSSTTPVAWVGSILLAEFVDQQLKHIRWNDDDDDDTTSTGNDIPSQLHNSSSDNHHQHPSLPTVAMVAYRKVAHTKREQESNKPNGLVILQATLTCRNPTETFDITDTLQFWVVHSQLKMSFSDVRLLWQVSDRIYKKESVVNDQSVFWWWNSWFRKSETIHEKKEMEDTGISTLYVRYQYSGMTYEIAFDAMSTVGDTYDTNENENKDNRNNNYKNIRPTVIIQIPNRNAMELGPSNRVR